MANFMTLTPLGRTDGQKILVNLDQVKKVAPFGMNGTRLYFAGGTDYVDVQEDQGQIALASAQ